MPNLIKKKDEATRTISDAYDYIKYPWIVIMGTALSQGIEAFYKCLISFRQPHGFITISHSLIALVIFLATFFRIYLGDSKYFTLSQNLALDAQSTGNRKVFNRIFSRKRRTFDTFFLFLMAVSFVFLALSITRPHAFTLAYLALLLTNVIWLRMISNESHKDEEDVSKHLKVWIMNNFLHFVLILAAFLFSYGSSASFVGYVIFLLMATYIVFDFYFTSSFYFPDADDFLQVDPETPKPRFPI